VLARYQEFTPNHNVGFLFGLKLPTGSHTMTGQSGDANAPDSVAIDQGLQPGTGTTDLLLGVYVANPLNKDWHN